MPTISQKGGKMPASPIRKLAPYAEKAKHAGRKIYHLNIGQPDIRTPEIALEKIRNLDRSIIEYSHSAGFASYREKLVRYYDSYGIELSPEQIMVTTGGSEAILFGMMSCMDPGDEIIVPEPFYANYNGFAIAGNIVIRPVTSHIEDGFALPSMDAFEDLVNPKTKAILICNPSNPTGYLYTQQEMQRLREIVLKHDIFLFADEVYREFCYDGEVHHSALNLRGLEEHVVVVDSVSKRYSACGARVGALISRNMDVMGTALKFAQARLSPPTLGQIVAEAALETGESYFEEVIGEYVSRRDQIVSDLNKMEGVICPVPGGAFYCMVRLPVDDSDRFCQWLLEEFSHENQTVMLAPGSGFYATPGLGKDEARIAYVLNRDDLALAMECLRLALEAYPGRVVKEAGVTERRGF